MPVMRYADEKLWVAADALATGHGKLQDRLVSAVMGVHTLKRDDFIPGAAGDALWQRFAEIIDGLTKEKARADEGTLAATARTLSDNDAQEFAERFFNLFVDVSHHYFVSYGAPE